MATALPLSVYEAKVPGVITGASATAVIVRLRSAQLVLYEALLLLASKNQPIVRVVVSAVGSSPLRN